MGEVIVTDNPSPEVAERARALGVRFHDFHCRKECAPGETPSTTALGAHGWRFTWGCGYMVGVTSDVVGLDALEQYWRQA